MIEEVVFDTSPFWICMTGLPPGYLNERSGRQMATMAGRVIGYTGRDAMSMRLKVVVDIEKPIKAGFFLEREDLSPLWIQFKYEKLGRFCFKCGIIGHEHDECARKSWAMVRSTHSPMVHMYGGWLYAESATDSCFYGVEKLIGRISKSEAASPPPQRGIEHQLSRMVIMSPGRAQGHPGRSQDVPAGSLGKYNSQEKFADRENDKRMAQGADVRRPGKETSAGGGMFVPGARGPESGEVEERNNTRRCRAEDDRKGDHKGTLNRQSAEGAMVLHALTAGVRSLQHQASGSTVKAQERSCLRPSPVEGKLSIVGQQDCPIDISEESETSGGSASKRKNAACGDTGKKKKN